MQVTNRERGNIPNCIAPLPQKSVADESLQGKCTAEQYCRAVKDYIERKIPEYQMWVRLR